MCSYQKIKHSYYKIYILYNIKIYQYKKSFSGIYKNVRGFVSSLF